MIWYTLILLCYYLIMTFDRSYGSMNDLHVINFVIYSLSIGNSATGNLLVSTNTITDESLNTRHHSLIFFYEIFYSDISRLSSELRYNSITTHFSQSIWHYLMMTSSNGNIFSVTGPLYGEFTGDQWIPLTQAIGEKLWYFNWSTPEPTVK